MAEDRPAISSPAVRSFFRMAGDVFLGIAVGLVGYYGITDLQTRADQTQLRTEAPASMFSEAVVSEGTTWDLEGWREEDLAYWKGLEKGEPMGRLVAGRMGLDAVVVKGVRRADLQKGPGWIDYTSYPGPRGNAGVSGHRTTYGAPFRRLDRLGPGDTIRFYSPFRRYTYRVKRSFSVTPDRVDVVGPTRTPTLTLTACDPPYSARYRLIVQADLVEVRRLAR